MGPREIAAFQMEAVHEDLAAGFFREFSALGYGCRAYFNERIFKLRGDFFSRIAHPNIEVTYPPIEGRPAWDALAERVRAQQPKALYVNTMQRDGIARWVDQFGLPILAVVHNPFLFEASEQCCDLARTGRLDLFGLAPHVVSTLLERVPELEGRAHVHYPYVWMPDGADAYDEDPEVLDIVVPGAVNFENRDFQGLLDFLRSGEANRQRPFKLSILAGGPDRGKLVDAISSYGIERFFDLARLDPETNRVPHETYLKRLHECHAVLPLLPVGRRDYVTSKVTTGVMAGLGIARPIITTSRVGKAYGFAPIETPEDRPFDLRAADLSAETLTHRRAEALKIRSAALAQNQRKIRAILDRTSGNA